MSSPGPASEPLALLRPALALQPAALDELELLLGGLYSPADGYCLPAQTPAGWPARFTLEVPLPLAAEALRHGALELTDADGTPLAALAVRTSAPGGPDTLFLAGPLSPLQPAEHPPARTLRLTRPVAAENGGPLVVAAFRAEPSAAAMAAALTSAAGATLLLVAVVPSQRPGGNAASGLLAALQRCAAEVPGARVGLLVEPVDPRGPQPDGGLTRYALERLGGRTVLEFSPATDAGAGSGPAWGSRGREASRLQRAEGLVVFFTGLSGAGKSTVARALAERLQDADPRAVILLDGDDVRRLLSSELGFSPADRDLNVRRIAWVAAAVARSGGIAICAPIAPHEATRAQARLMAEDSGTFVLVHVSTPLEVCEGRDRKGLYAKARAGLLTSFTGIDAPYEVPTDADLMLDTASMPVDAAVDAVLALLARRSRA
ncbi:adenylyl-sulfate kinase [Paenarthrobacter sp. DKR-5]|uniref:adenylyl-sulfate kinase n=1 Tax=Paenarthrobacter sp. DKR-5 TaxID=2835535 RepID=UPI001BDD5F31|nr:adenylyl-sulfate kinase [Paenarthrobacter sp. DKR-5]MBT1002461.1 adenylyl-sulfate kinase [Paenarthrobacter sp. DKR-5]